MTTDRSRQREHQRPAEERAAAILEGVDEVELTIEKLVAGGDGLGRVKGAPIFVPRSAPGDRLRVRITERRRDFGRAEIAEILKPGPGRREAPCPHYDECGGCDLQHLDDEVQLRLKAEAVGETLMRLGRVALPSDPKRVEVIGGKPFGYRLRTQLQVGRPEPQDVEEIDSETANRPQVGYFRRGSHDLVTVDRCPVLVGELEELLPVLPSRLDAAQTGGARMPKRLDLAAGQGGAITTAPVVGDLPHGEVRLRIGNFDYAYDARCFFQGHRGLLDTLVEKVVGPDNSENSEAQADGTAYDLYAGVGLFSLPLAQRYQKVVAVESDRIASRYGRRNARLNGVKTVDWVHQATETWAEQFPKDAARVVADPPRTGMTGKVLSALRRRPPRRLTYVSCHPAALARDLRRLGDAFHVERIVMIDLFPQTGHMETIVQLIRAEA